MSTTQKTSRFFTLIEVMIGITLLLIASTAVGLKMHHAVKKKQFQSELERLRARLTVCQKLAVAMQADWKGVLTKKGKEWIFEVNCEEGKARKLAPLVLHFNLLLDGKNVDRATFDFFASGQVLPVGTLRFSQDEERVEWKVSDIFQREEGKKLGPLHPLES